MIHVVAASARPSSSKRRSPSSSVRNFSTLCMTFLVLVQGSFRSRGAHAFVSSFVSKSVQQQHAIAPSRFGLWSRSLPAAFWTSSSCLFQSSAAVQDEEITKPSKPQDATTTKIVAHEKDFVKPDPDLRQYRWIRLANNLQVLLVSTLETAANDDEDSEASHVEAAAVHVQAGHMDDTIPGLAHFHEHMLFLGTKKYPTENEYEKFLSKYGGFSNAYTDMEDTNYYFSLTTTPTASSNGNGHDDDNSQHKSAGTNGATTSAALEGSLDRFAQFFVEPLFEQSMVEREIRAIDSEWRNSRTSDNWRNYQMLKASANPKHPFAKFGCGNYETLTTNNTTSPRPELLNFWETYYRTCNLRLAVVGFASLDALQASVEKTFGQLPYSQGKPRREPDVDGDTSQVFPHEHAIYGGVPAFGPEQLGKLQQIIPIMETRVLKLFFATPPVNDPVGRESRPHRIISHLLGHESPGSLHSLLNDLGLVQSLSSGMGISNSDFSLFSLSMGLTPKGMQQKNQVLDLVFQWLAVIREIVMNDTEENLHLMEQYNQELKQMVLNGFKFRENGDPTDFCSTVAELMFDSAVPPEQILLGGNLESPYDPVISKVFMERLTPENALIVEINSDLAKEEAKATTNGSSEWNTEPWYGAKYRAHDLTRDELESWRFPKKIDERLKLPGLNQYIPTDFSLRCDDEKDANGDSTATMLSDAERQTPPKLLIKRPDLRLWHKMDRSWRVPKAFIKLSMMSPNIYRSPRSMTYNRIYQRILNDDLKSTVYDAGLAGCGYRVACTPSSIRISVQGYNEKLPALLNTVTSRMLGLLEEMKEGPEKYPALHEKFEKAKESLLRETKNYRLDSPYEIASYNSRLILEESVWYLNEYVNEMEGEYAELNPLTMEECAQVAEECLTGPSKAEAICMGNINEKEARKSCQVIDDHFFNKRKSRPLSEAEIPTFRTLTLPTWEEAALIFGSGVVDDNRTVPLVYQELAYSPSEENNALEFIIQTGSDLELGYEGLAVLELIAHMSYNSAFNQLRTQEQLGYIVSTFPRRTSGGGWGLSVVVQSSVAVPEVLEQRVENWLLLFRTELENMEPESLASEAAGVVSSLKERDTKLSQEVNKYWGEIVNTEGYTHSLEDPAFDRIDRLADELTLLDDERKDTRKTTLNGNIRKTPEALKERALQFLDKYISSASPERRAMSARVYNQANRALYEANLDKPGILKSFAEIRHVKQFLSSRPLAPYWRPAASTTNTCSSSDTPTTDQ